MILLQAMSTLCKAFLFMIFISNFLESTLTCFVDYFVKIDPLVFNDCGLVKSICDAPFNDVCLVSPTPHGPTPRPTSFLLPAAVLTPKYGPGLGWARAGICTEQC